MEYLSRKRPDAPGRGPRGDGRRALLAAAAIAAAHLLAAPPAAGEADPERGLAVAVGGPRDLSAQGACFSCHGLDGAGDSSGAFPRLTGQPAWYLYKQLKDYASGKRPNDIMTPIAKSLTDAEMIDVAAYYAAQTAPFPPPPDIESDRLERGGALAAVGIPDQGVQPCGRCHGPLGLGWPPSVPYLAGQYAVYMELQLLLWKDGTRENDPLGVMESIAAQLSPEDIEAVSLYFATLRPPD